MLHELANYAVKYNVHCLPGFKPKTARWIIVLTEDGRFVDLVEERREFVLAPDLQQNELIAGGVKRSHFLLDALGVVTAFDASGKELLKHSYFIELLRQAAAQEPIMGKIVDLLNNSEIKQQINEVLKAAKARKTDAVTFRVGNVYPVELNTWHGWWQQFRRSLKPGDETGNSMVCLLSGEQAKPRLTHFKISGMTRVGGQSTGTVLVGFDKESFTSYGLEQSLNAACSEESAAMYRSALEALIAKAPPPLAGTMFLAWFKEPVPEEDNLLDFAVLENPEAEEAGAREKVERLLKAVEEGKRPDLLHNRYFILQVSATGGRIMVRDWLEGDFHGLADNLRKWFADLEITSPDGKGRAQDFKLTAALIRMVSYRKNEGIRKTMERIDRELPPLMPRVWRSILGNLPFPDVVASKALAYIRSTLYSTDDGKTLDNLDRVACALLKAWLIRNKSSEGGKAMKTHLNPNHPAPAYHAGRLMAVLAAIQQSALGDVGAGVVQRYYAAASTTPALVLGRLVRGAQHHLDKLEKGLAVWYEKLLAEIAAQVGDDLPGTLTLEGQTLFALGYYQQKAAMFAGYAGHKDK
ncbi:hypothetical protein SY88_02150 [Clostridiales bacterium PH28_bin88]|nr:hypothetical protein SY88_02150 [Clostridiales bacterium PH28_bin88]